MIKIITFTWADTNLFEKHNCSLRHNEEMSVPDNSAIDMALAQAKVVLESGLNVMIRSLPDRKIIWVAADDRNFGQR